MKKANSALLAVFIALIAVFAATMTACGDDDGSNYIFKYDIDSNPRTLDPQTATDESALIIIENMFEGLLRLNSDGDVSAGAAGEYTVSDDGLTYTFLLRDDIYWSDGEDFAEKCTADDFVFAFRRLFNPATKSTHAEEFFCIKNAEKFNNKSITDPTKIGVAADGDYKLTITLEYPNPMFTVLLTTAPAMPCNESFYLSTEGKYGLRADCIASNGAFFLYSWSYDEWSTNNNNLILRRNAKNDEAERVWPYGLNFFIDETSPYSNFTAEESHCLAADGDSAVTLIESGYRYTACENSVAGILFNTKGAFGNDDLRCAMAMAVDRSTFPKNVTGYSSTESLIPPAIKLGDKAYRSLAGSEEAIPFDPKSAKNYYDKGIEKTGFGATEEMTLIMRENEVLTEALGYILQQWQASMSFFVNVKVLGESEYYSALRSGEFDIALVEYTGDYNSPSAFLNYFIGNDNNYSGYQNKEFQSLVYSAERADSTAESLEAYKKAENILLGDGVFVPLCSRASYFFSGEHCEDIVYNPFTKTIDFRNAKYVK